MPPNLPIFVIFLLPFPIITDAQYHPKFKPEAQTPCKNIHPDVKTLQFGRSKDYSEDPETPIWKIHKTPIFDWSCNNGNKMKVNGKITNYDLPDQIKEGKLNFVREEIDKLTSGDYQLAYNYEVDLPPGTPISTEKFIYRLEFFYNKLNISHSLLLSG